MEIRIQSIHFDASQQLQDFVQKKAARLARRYPMIDYIAVNMRLIKPETAQNKEVTIKAIVPNRGEQVASKTADTFEEANDFAQEAIERQLEKIKIDK